MDLADKFSALFIVGNNGKLDYNHSNVNLTEEVVNALMLRPDDLMINNIPYKKSKDTIIIKEDKTILNLSYTRRK